MDLTIKIPEDVWQAIKLPDTDNKQDQLLLELAISLYERGILSLEKSRLMANMTKWEFDQELGKRKIIRHYSQNDLDNDIIHGLS